MLFFCQRANFCCWMLIYFWPVTFQSEIKAPTLICVVLRPYFRAHELHSSELVPCILFSLWGSFLDPYFVFDYPINCFPAGLDSKVVSFHKHACWWHVCLPSMDMLLKDVYYQDKYKCMINPGCKSNLQFLTHQLKA